MQPLILKFESVGMCVRMVKLTVHIKCDSGAFAQGHSQVGGHTCEVLSCVCVQWDNRKEAACSDSLPIR